MTTSTLTSLNLNMPYSKLFKKALLLFCALFMLLGLAYAQTVNYNYQFDSQEQEKLFYEIISELRCPQCQNNNIAESNAGLSSDMRQKVYELIKEGQTKKEIVDYMVGRYGNFITYDPPLNTATIILWVAPALSLLIGLIYILRRSRQDPTKLVTENETVVDDKEIKSKKSFNKDSKRNVTKGKKTPTAMFLSLSIFFLMGSTAFIFYATTDWEQIEHKKQATAALPQLKETYQAGRVSSVMQVQQLAIGLRNQLANNPNSAEDWYLLGEIYDDYMMRPDEAKEALERAFFYSPHDQRIQSLYAQLLLRTSPAKVDRILAIRLLNEAVTQKPDDVNSLYWLALYAQSEEQYMKSIGLWENILKILPPFGEDANRIKKHLENDKQAYEQQLKNSRS